MSRGVSGGMLMSCLVSQGDMSGDHAVDLIVVILAGPESRHMAQRTRDDTLGLAVRDATMAFVLFDRITNVASTHHAFVVGLLGHVLAGEVGHLLLPANSHSDRGLMQAAWKPGTLLVEFFTTSQAERIRQCIASLRANEGIYTFGDRR